MSKREKLSYYSMYARTQTTMNMSNCRFSAKYFRSKLLVHVIFYRVFSISQSNINTNIPEITCLRLSIPSPHLLDCVRLV